MATTGGKADKSSEASKETGTQGGFEADIAQLRADMDQLKRHLSETGEHAAKSARRAANDGAEQARAQGEAALAGLKTNAREVEDQVGRAVQEKPITALAMAAGVGFILALLARR